MIFVNIGYCSPAIISKGFVEDCQVEGWHFSWRDLQGSQI